MNHRRSNMLRQPRSATSRGYTLRTTIEPLEARSMLSATSSTVDQVADRLVEVVRVDEIAPSTLHSIVDGLIGGVGFRTEYGRIINSRSDEDTGSSIEPSRELSVLIPPAKGETPSLPVSDDLSNDDVWQEDPRIPMPDDSAPGGFTEINDFDTPFIEAKEQNSPSSAPRILDILATLHYLPKGLRPELGESAEVSSSLETESQATIEPPSSELSPSEQASSESPSDGGMIALAPVEELVLVAETEPSTSASPPLTSDESIPIQQMQGKFQAFEMSHGEELPPSAEAVGDAAAPEAETLPEFPIEPVSQSSLPRFFHDMEALDAAISEYALEDPLKELVDPRDREDSATEALSLPAIDPAAAAVFILSVTTALRTPRDPQSQTVTVKRLSSRPNRG